MNVLSLFDGMSCGQIALNRSGVKIDNYFASEVDKYAMQVTKKNFPNTVQMGDVTNWRQWDIEWSKIGLIQAGSPCQGFSFAGKQLAFNDPRSALFFEFVNILNHVRKFNPDVKFLLENVRMKKEYLQIISSIVGVEPIMINSSLLSAQNRVRFYWTNIKGVEQPEDKGLILSDVVEEKIEEYEFPKEKTIHKLFNVNPSGNGMNGWVYGCNAKSPTLTTNKGEGVKILIVPEATKKGYCIVEDNQGVDLTFINSKTRRGRLMKDKCNCLTATNYDYFFFKDSILRKLTPLECERLQTVPDNYTEGVSNSQRYKMLGNGWTVDVIAHIFSFMKF